jgi:hypothetical protein
MLRLAVLLSIAVVLAATAGGAQARPQPYAGISPPPPQHAVTPSDGPGWTLAILGGIAVMLVFGAAGAALGRASVRPQARMPRHA